MEITCLELYKGDTYRIELDGDETVFVNCSVVSDFSLYKGMILDGDTLAQIKQSDSLRKARKRALYLLGTREYCYNELCKKLRESYDEDTARAAADSMREYGYINDEEYAPKLAEYLIHTKHYGVRKARWEMLQRGLDEYLVEDALAQFSDEEIDEEITELLLRKYYSKLEDFSARRRTIAALARRGYDYRAVKRCIERILEENEDEE
ncbi:MAG: regulatory protein RecX [Oscillospiraceae bacterium]